MKLRMDEPEEFAACAGAGVQGLVPDLADFWSRYLIAARDRGEIHQDTDIAEASEWVARVLLSLATVPGDTLDPSDADAVPPMCAATSCPACGPTPPCDFGALRDAERPLARRNR